MLRLLVRLALWPLCAALPAAAAITAAPVGLLPDGHPVTEYVLTNAHGLKVRLLDFGPTITAIETPDRDGKLADITMGYRSLDGWLDNRPHFGAMLGRFANRIGHGRIVLDGLVLTLPTNSEAGGVPSLIHGGRVPFDKQLWKARILPATNSVEFSLVSPDGDQGFPGRLEVSETFILNDQNELRIVCLATTNKNTVVNLSNHTYWNLSGDGAKDVLPDLVEIEADRYLPMNEGHLPTGEIAPVAGTPFDFTTPKTIGDALKGEHPQLAVGRGFDHCMVLKRTTGVRRAARVSDPRSGRVIELRSDQPGVQFFTPRSLTQAPNSKGHAPYVPHNAFCLEPERFPDSPNEPSFPSAELRPGETYHQTMIWRFSVAP